MILDDAKIPETHKKSGKSLMKISWKSEISRKKSHAWLKSFHAFMDISITYNDPLEIEYRSKQEPNFYRKPRPLCWPASVTHSFVLTWCADAVCVKVVPGFTDAATAGARFVRIAACLTVTVSGAFGYEYETKEKSWNFTFSLFSQVG